MTAIRSIASREILDSRGNPTIETMCELSDGATGAASVPSGASTGSHEALELRDGDMGRYGGKGVLGAVASVQGEIARHLLGKELAQQELDAALIELDGTPQKSRFGANAILSVSFAFARACAASLGIPLFEHLARLSETPDPQLPLAAFNIVNGGKHAKNGLDIQEYMIIPVGFPTLDEKTIAAKQITIALRDLLDTEDKGTSLGDEGGFAPGLSSNDEAFDFLVRAIERAGYTTEAVKIAVDVAASSFYRDGVYELSVGGDARIMSTDDLIRWYEELVRSYPIISIEDGLAEDDWEGFSKMTAAMGKAIQIVGDDLTVTNPERIHDAMKREAVNAVIIKPNQIGTLTETIEAVRLTKGHGWAPFVSHRSGETMDTFISDLAVGMACPYLKAGAPTKPERLCKYERLIEIERTLGVR